MSMLQVARAPEIRLEDLPSPPTAPPRARISGRQPNGARKNQNGSVAGISPARSLKTKLTTRVKQLRNGDKTAKEPPGAKLSSSHTGSFLGSITQAQRPWVWPNPELSIGTSCVVQGKYKCWQATGPAKELTRELVDTIRKELGRRYEEIHEGQNSKKIISIGIYMMGNSEQDACPTLMISGESSTPRKRAMKMVAESNKLDEFREKYGKSVLLGGSAIVPISSGRVRQPAGESSKGIPLKSNSEVNVFREEGASFDPALQIYIQSQATDGSLRYHKATVGCILKCDDKCLAWTVRHPFLGFPEEDDASRSSSIESDFDFVFDEKYGFEPNTSRHNLTGE